MQGWLVAISKSPLHLHTFSSKGTLCKKVLYANRRRDGNREAHSSSPQRWLHRRFIAHLPTTMYNAVDRGLPAVDNKGPENHLKTPLCHREGGEAGAAAAAAASSSSQFDQHKLCLLLVVICSSLIEMRLQILLLLLLPPVPVPLQVKTSVGETQTHLVR